jgi:polyisoprenoid-binding protein YceI
MAENGTTQTSAEVENATNAVGSEYVIDRRAGRFTVRAFASGMLAKMGHNPTIAVRDISGRMKFNPEGLEAGDFRLVVKAASLSVQDDVSDKDRREIERLMNEEVLEVAKFPEIRYETASVPVTKASEMLYSATLDGELTLHGITRKELISARVTLFGSMLRASGDLTLHQSDYGIKPVSVAGGVLKVKDELKLSFEIVARRND